MVAVSISMMRFRLFTLGCKVNQYETQSIREDFLSKGYMEVSNGQVDICVINTCTVTARADAKSRRAIREAVRKNPAAVVVVTGCYVQGSAKDIASIPGVDLMVGNEHKKDIVDLVTQGKSQIPQTLPGQRIPQTNGNSKYQTSFHAPKLSNRYLSLSISDFQGHTKAFVKIQDGCDNYCSYCKVPLVRGPSRSRPLDDIKNEVEHLANKGFREVVLCGICLGAYGKDLNKEEGIIEVLEELEKKEELERIRLSSIEPNYVTQRLIQKISDSKKICPHLHIPLQSGSDKILHNMNRTYTAHEYISLVEKAKALTPDISITTDVMVGFPGESEQDFNKTLKVLEQVKPSRVHVFSFSKRMGTKAFCLKEQVPNQAIAERMSGVRDLAKKTSLEYRKRFLGRPVSCLVENSREQNVKFLPPSPQRGEGMFPVAPSPKEGEGRGEGAEFLTSKGKIGLLTGYTDTYIKVVFEGPDELMNQIVPIRITEVAPTYTMGNVK